VRARAGGPAAEAAATAVVVRRRVPAASDTGAAATSATETIEIGLAAPFEPGDPRREALVHPGDVVHVRPAGVIYVVGEVRRPGAFPLDRRPGLTVLQAIALGEGLGARAARGRAVIIRTGRSGERTELPVDLGDVLAGRTPDVPLQPRDVVFVPSSAAKSASLGVVDALVRMVTLRAVF
jgi:polysaccharide biosynthesis/export protein